MNKEERKNLKTAKTKAELWRTLFAATNATVGTVSLIILIYAHFIR